MVGRNITFPIYNADGTPFHNLVLRKATFSSVVMSLGDKITGDVYYPNNHLVVTMQEYIEYKSNEDSDVVRYYLVNPPTVVREGLASDNGQMAGMTKYSFEFYHPMTQLGNMAFTDVAVTQSEERYLSQNKTFSWIGDARDYVDKLNANLDGTQWVVRISGSLYDEYGQPTEKITTLSEVLSFDNNTIGDALKTFYETYEIPFVIDQIDSTDADYARGKRFLILVGLPSNKILDAEGNEFVFQFGHGVGLKNNSRTPKNNKIVTRLAGYGSENNIPYGYPQIRWYGNQDWDYTINNDANAIGSYPIYKGILGGQYVKLIKHPFTRNHLMPSIYRTTLFNKVSPYLADGSANPNYDPETTIIDYYDADATFPNPIVQSAPSYEIHQFEDVKPELGEAYLAGVTPWNNPKQTSTQKVTQETAFLATILNNAASTKNENERSALLALYNAINSGQSSYSASNTGGAYTYDCVVTSNTGYYFVKYTSDNVTYDVVVQKTGYVPQDDWDDTMDDNGEYIQSYFKVTLPILDFDIYACASITEQMDVKMRSGACIGCTFPIEVDWDDYKKNFYASDGTFAPDGEQRDLTKYPKSNIESITVIVKKDLETFGTLMPNIYQQPKVNDQFVILGISLPDTYINTAESRLDDDMHQYLLDNNVYYYDYPLKFDEYFLATHTNILEQMRNNTIVSFRYGNEPTMKLYIKQMTVKYGDKPLPQYDITLTDDVEIVLNQIGQVTDDVSRVRVELSELQKYYSESIIQAISDKISRVADDVAQGLITFQQGLNSIGRAIFSDELRSPNFQTGLYTGQGWRIDNLGNAEFESIRARSFLEIVELLINRMQAEEGDTLFTDNDQIEKVERVVDETDQSVSYILSLKSKYDGYVTSQMYGNILKGIINTLAAKQAGVSNIEDEQTVERDGSNSYFTSWMRVIGTNNTDNTLGVNQIRVVLYGDNLTPAGKNFEPCQLMTIARWGCVDYSDPTDPDYEAVKASIIRRQRVFAISTTDGRVVKYTGVDSPILKNGNYGVTIGELPEFVKAYSEVAKVLAEVGEHTDWLYAQGVVVQNFVQINKEGLPIPRTVFCGDWVDGSSVETPAVGAGIYYYNQYNDDALQFETHEVRHNGGRWQCLQSQPVISGGVATYYEPKWNSPYWMLVDGNDNLTIEFVSSKGYSFRRGAVNTDITPHLFYGNVDITEEVAAEYWSWTRESESGKTVADESWDAQHTGLVTGKKTLHLTNNDMPQTWSSANKAIFTCTVSVNDGKTTRIVDNQIIS